MFFPPPVGTVNVKVPLFLSAASRQFLDTSRRKWSILPSPLMDEMCFSILSISSSHDIEASSALRGGYPNSDVFLRSASIKQLKRNRSKRPQLKGFVPPSYPFETRFMASNSSFLRSSPLAKANALLMMSSSTLDIDSFRCVLSSDLMDLFRKTSVPSGPIQSISPE